MRIAIFYLLTLTVVIADELQQFQDSNLHFASDIYKKISTKNDDNFIVCPLSAQVILSLATVGARNATAKQLSNCLHLPEDLSKIKNIFEKVNKNLENKQLYKFISANKIFLNNKCSIKKEFKDIAINSFKAGIENVNFKDTKTTVEQINNWVENTTNNKIKNVITEESIDNPDLTAILINALYFEGYWLYEFGDSLGYIEKFYTGKNETTEFYAMTQRNDFNYYYNEEIRAEFLELPFVGNDVTMTFVLPKDKDGISELEKHILTILSPQPLELSDVMVTLPIFKTESRIQFKEILESLGVTEPFTSDANFNGISDVPLYISDVIQKTFIEINERGATAAAATEIMLMMESMPSVFFNANHPFIYFLKHKVYGILFVGRFSTPVV